MMSSVLVILLIVFVLGPIAKAYAERLTRELPPDAAQQRAELARMREEMERLSTQVARLEDEQSFLVRLLGEGRPAGGVRGEAQLPPPPAPEPPAAGEPSAS